ncbi:MAG TPA: hypothetical protein VL361_08530 [Candidatus Limnocylindrales bacterium]|nr:hypothetical protein [Candidatus Limnocylindrales bacterium]
MNRRVEFVMFSLLIVCDGCKLPRASSHGRTAERGWPATQERKKIEFYVIVKEGTPYHARPNPFPFSQEQIQKAQREQESRPADTDPDGNWGSVVEGFQLSLRFEKETYTNGEPLNAWVLLRNVSDRPLIYPFEGSPDERELTFVLFSGKDRVYGKFDQRPGASLEERLRMIRTGHGWTRVSPVGSQHKSCVDVSQTYGLLNVGEYVMHAKREILTSYWTAETNVVSGKARFRIVEK